MVPSHALQVNAAQLNGKSDAILVQHATPNTPVSFLQQQKFTHSLEVSHCLFTSFFSQEYTHYFDIVYELMQITDTYTCCWGMQMS